TYLVPFTIESVRQMLQSNCVVAVRHQGAIVAIAMGEIAECVVDGNVITISEISEVATHPDFQSKGLSHLAFRHLLTELRAKEIDLIFMEARAASYGMMAVGWDGGLLPCGRLEQHCLISSPFSDVGQDSVYGDLVVFALPPQR
ncbi:MAG: GNAT family N-acetyltransferase, partial [bacterium]|nr:GNAT family N-acetyltransferase [bacterium]